MRFEGWTRGLCMSLCFVLVGSAWMVVGADFEAVYTGDAMPY